MSTLLLHKGRPVPRAREWIYVDQRKFWDPKQIFQFQLLLKNSFLCNLFLLGFYVTSWYACANVQWEALLPIHLIIDHSNHILLYIIFVIRGNKVKNTNVKTSYQPQINHILTLTKCIVFCYPGYQPMSNLAANFGRAKCTDSHNWHERAAFQSVGVLAVDW